MKRQPPESWCRHDRHQQSGIPRLQPWGGCQREVLADADHELSTDGRRELLEQNYRVHTTTQTGEVA